MSLIQRYLGWNRGFPLYTEVSSFLGGWNRGVPLYYVPYFYLVPKLAVHNSSISVIGPPIRVTGPYNVVMRVYYFNLPEVSTPMY